MNNQLKNKVSEPEHSTSSAYKALIFIGTVTVILILGKVFGAGEKLGALKDWIESFGAYGPFVFAILYILSTVAALPGSAITLAAGALFGSFKGVIIVSIASTCGASLAFLIGRYFARDAVETWLSKQERFRKLDRMTEQHGAFIVALTRLVPVFPFNLLNYGFGLTRIRFATYVFWSWLCMLPGTIVFVGGADAITRVFSEGHIPAGLVVVLIAMVTVLVILGRYARQKLQTDGHMACKSDELK